MVLLNYKINLQLKLNIQFSDNRAFTIYITSRTVASTLQCWKISYVIIEVAHVTLYVRKESAVGYIPRYARLSDAACPARYYPIIIQWYNNPRLLRVHYCELRRTS